MSWYFTEFVNSNPRSSAHFHKPNIKKVYKGVHSSRCFGPIVWVTMVPEKIKSITTFLELKRELNVCRSQCTLTECRSYTSRRAGVVIHRAASWPEWN